MTSMKNIITFFIAFLIFKSDLLADINKLKVDVPKSY